MKKLFLIPALLISAFACGQLKYYSAPVKIPMLLSGSFAELRSNHFHSGIDIKTQGVTGIPIYSVADGYISRIVVSPSGYGNALYIIHPNGTTSVYGHLDSFRDDIARYVKESQYRKESYKVNLSVLPGTFPVNKNEQIGKSGNSGSSGGPHLHFEIRDTPTNQLLNPLKFNFEIKDTIPPRLFSLMLVPLSDTSHVLHDGRKRRFDIVSYNGAYHIKNNPTVPVYGEVGFAVETNDYLNNSWNKCGLYSLQLTVDDELYYYHQLDNYSFAEDYYINSHIDYETYISLKRRFQKTWVDPGNNLSTYNYLKGSGSFHANGNGKHEIRIEVKDTYGNTSILKFNIESKRDVLPESKETFISNFYFKQANHFENHDFSITIPENALYKNLNFKYKTLPQAAGYYSKIHVVHENTVPLHKSVEIRIKTENLPKDFKNKALLVKIDDKSGEQSAVGGKFENDWIISKTRTFGHFAIKIDTIPPTITPLSISTNSTLRESKQVRFRVSDDLAGIKKIEGYLDGKWALFEYDAKNDLITHKFDNERFEFDKKHNLKLSVSDQKENISTYEANFWK